VAIATAAAGVVRADEPPSGEPGRRAHLDSPGRRGKAMQPLSSLAPASRSGGGAAGGSMRKERRQLG
jgi:hypothetical protein